MLHWTSWTLKAIAQLTQVDGRAIPLGGGSCEVKCLKSGTSSCQLLKVEAYRRQHEAVLGNPRQHPSELLPARHKLAKDFYSLLVL